MVIHLATDHAGFAHKEHLKAFLITQGYKVIDHGAHEFTQSDDYPDFVFPCAEAVAQDINAKGIVLGHSGQGEAMVANKVKGIRAVVYYGGTDEIITLSREHNDANILSLGAHFLTHEEVEKVTDLWLKSTYTADERHVRRIKKIHTHE
jgi:ribose 5-phosphate isomerase B